MRVVFLVGAFVWAAACGASERPDNSAATTATDGGSDPPSDSGGAASDANRGDASSPGDAGGGDATGPGPDPRYGAVENLSGAAFRTGLSSLVGGHTSLGYDAARDVLLGAPLGKPPLQATSNQLECVYTGKLVAPDGTRTPNGFNTEHTWPQSLGAGSEPARSDLHHLFPVDETANNARGNLPYAMTSCTTSCAFDTGGSRKGPLLGGGATEVFEVRPVRRGDVARALFYFSVRYSLSIDDFEESALRGWHDADPPDAAEKARNDAIEALQKNRNPFVDRPDFAAKISDF